MKNDIFNASGDVFNARGDVFSATGDVFNAYGDVFNNANPLYGKSYDEVIALYKNPDGSDKPWDDNYRDYMSNPDGGSDSPSTNNKSFVDKLFGGITAGLGAVDKGVDILNKYKSGQTTVDESGLKYTVDTGIEEPKSSNTIWYVAGGIVVVLIGIGIYMSRKNK
jgi:hypothetical protein